MRIDLHTHSKRSDGTDTPTELVENAARARLDVVALTDHDHALGWDEAQAAADRVGIRLVRGMEISTSIAGRSVHLLAYDLDPTYAPLATELALVLDSGIGRMAQMVEKLNARGVEVTLDDVLLAMGDAKAPQRPHLADALVARGHVATRDEAFERWLDGPIHVPKHKITTEDAVRLVVEAGGRPVVAHGWSRSSRPLLTAAKFEELAALGLAGIEVDHADHDADARAALRDIARSLDLAVTGSSDYHGAGKDLAHFGLGANLTQPDELERLLG